MSDWLKQALRGKWNTRLLLCIAVLGPVCFYIYTAWVAPRPYFIREMDLEPDYYYNSLMVHDGNPVPGIHHPGTPIYYLGALILNASGASLDRTQAFFNISYLIIALLTGAAMGAFVWLALRKTPLGISMLSIASVLVWPPFLTYMNHFGSESFIVAFGLPTIAVFWKSLELRGVSQKRLLFVCGMGTGLCLATKMTFLPVAVAIAGASFLGSFAIAGRMPQSLRLLLAKSVFEAIMKSGLIVAGAILGFVICTAPIFSRIPKLLYATLIRREAHLSGGLMSGFMKTYAHLFEANWLFAVFVVSLLGLFCVALVWAIVTAKSVRGFQGLQMSPDEDNFDYPTAGLFLGLMALGFCYCMASSRVIVKGYEAGIGLRNVSACALFLPFMITYTWRILGGKLNDNSQRWFQLGAVFLAVLLFANGLTFHLTRRRRFIEDQKAEMAAVENRLSEIRAQGTRIAFWNAAGPDIVGGECSFHFWGNFRYAFNHYSWQLLQRYPNYTFFDITTAVLRAHKENADEKPKGSTYGPLGDAIWRLINRPGPYSQCNELYAGEKARIPISVMMFPSKVMWPQIINRIVEQTGASGIESETIGGIDYLLIRPGRFQNTQAPQ